MLKENQAESERLIQDIWQDEQCPTINGIIYGTGEILLLDFDRVTEGDDTAVSIRPAGKTNVASFLAEHEDYLTSITEFCEIQVQEEGVRISCGDGGFGGDGFVAVSRLSDNYLKWIAFFDNSNPFEEVSFAGSQVLAISSHRDKWLFPLAQPEQVSVVAGEPWGGRLSTR
jgi:hypothetical protein